MFKVKFPVKLGAAQITAASQALSMQKKPDVDMDVEDVATLEKYSESQRNTKAGLEDSDEEEESGHGHGGQRV